MLSEDISNRNSSFESYKQRITNFSNEFELGLFLYILRRSLLWIILILTTALTSALLYLKYTAPVYESRSIMQLDESNNAKQVLSMNTFAEDKTLPVATDPLPKNSMIRGVIGTKSLFDLAQMAMSFTGNPAQLKVPADVPPMAFGVTGDGGGTHIRFHAPMSVITAISDAAKQFRGGEGEEEEGEAPAEKKDEKPRF